jgi:hypothetical protein
MPVSWKSARVPNHHHTIKRVPARVLNGVVRWCSCAIGWMEAFAETMALTCGQLNLWIKQ